MALAGAKRGRDGQNQCSLPGCPCSTPHRGCPHAFISQPFYFFRNSFHVPGICCAANFAIVFRSTLIHLHGTWKTERFCLSRASLRPHPASGSVARTNPISALFTALPLYSSRSVMTTVSCIGVVHRFSADHLACQLDLVSSPLRRKNSRRTRASIHAPAPIKCFASAVLNTTVISLCGRAPARPKTVASPAVQFAFCTSPFLIVADFPKILPVELLPILFWLFRFTLWVGLRLLRLIPPFHSNATASFNCWPRRNSA